MVVVDMAVMGTPDATGLWMLRGICLALGLWIGGVTLRMWRRKPRPLPIVIGLLLAALLLLVAVKPATLGLFEHISAMLRIRFLMGTISLLVLLVTIESIRRSRLQERYALLWVATGVFILLGAFFTHLLDFLCAVMGMQYVSLIVTIIFTFLILVVFHFSIELSRYHEDRTRLAQRVALLEARLDEMQRTGAAQPPAKPRVPPHSPIA